MSYSDIWVAVTFVYDVLAVGYIFGKIHQSTKDDRRAEE